MMIIGFVGCIGIPHFIKQKFIRDNADFRHCWACAPTTVQQQALSSICGSKNVQLGPQCTFNTKLVRDDKVRRFAITAIGGGGGGASGDSSSKNPMVFTSGEGTFEPETDGAYYVLLIGGGGGGGGRSCGTLGTGHGASGGVISGIFRLTKSRSYHVNIGKGAEGNDEQDPALTGESSVIYVRQGNLTLKKHAIVATPGEGGYGRVHKNWISSRCKSKYITKCDGANTKQCAASLVLGQIFGTGGQKEYSGHITCDGGRGAGCKAPAGGCDLSQKGDSFVQLSGGNVCFEGVDGGEWNTGGIICNGATGNCDPKFDLDGIPMKDIIGPELVRGEYGNGGPGTTGSHNKDRIPGKGGFAMVFPVSMTAGGGGDSGHNSYYVFKNLPKKDVEYKVNLGKGGKGAGQGLTGDELAASANKDGKPGTASSFGTIVIGDGGAGGTAGFDHWPKDGSYNQTASLTQVIKGENGRTPRIKSTKNEVSDLSRPADGKGGAVASKDEIDGRDGASWGGGGGGGGLFNKFGMGGNGADGVVIVQW